jgi:hypothetical protein
MAIRPNTTILVTLLRRSKIAVDIAYLPRAENPRVKNRRVDVGCDDKNLVFRGRTIEKSPL